MRYPDGHKDGVRARIVAAAAKALRKDGLDRVSIPALMKKAGLTHGGFYGHFRDRDELVAAAILAGAHETQARVFTPATDVQQLLDVYLSPGHVRAPEHGCVVAALGSQGRGRGRPVRRAFAESARGLLRLIQTRLDPDAAPGVISDEALRLGATMVGAVVLARLLDDEALEARLLAAARRTP